MEDSPVAEENRSFTLYLDHDAADTSSYNRTLRFVSFFEGSVSGLTAGSSVTLHGLRIGAVTEVTLSYDATVDLVRVAVRYAVEPDRIAKLQLPGDDDLDKMMADLVHRGLRIRLESSSLVTGSKQLAMEVVPGGPDANFEKQDGAYVLPAWGGDQGDITAAASSLIARLQTIPFERIGDNLNKTLAGANGTFNDPKLRQAVAALNETLNATQSLMDSLNKSADALSRSLPRIASDLEGTVKHANQLVGSLDDNRGGGSQFGRDMTRTLSQLSDAARSVRMLADMLSRHPEALIRGRDEQEVR